MAKVKRRGWTCRGAGRRRWFSFRRTESKSVARTTAAQGKPRKPNLIKERERARHEEAVEQLQRRRAGLPRPKTEEGHIIWNGGVVRRAEIIVAPPKLSFRNNYQAMLGFIYEMNWQRYAEAPRNGRPRVTSTSLRAVKSVSLDGALVLTAEYHRACLRQPGFRPCINDADWPEEIRAVFDMLGFYNLVDASEHTAPAMDASSTLRFVPFISGERVEGELIDQLLGDLAAAAGKTPSRYAVYNAMLEAMNNAVQHAYPDDAPPQAAPRLRRWWAAGAYIPQNDELMFAFYDQGVGIPDTLPRQSIWEAIRRRCPPELNDADVIAGAIDYGRTSTEKLERGNGLWAICKLAEELDGSHVFILSGRGEVTYSSQGVVRKKLHDNPFCGTLIQWFLKMPSEPNPAGAPS